jgi:hypothetical protein
MARAFSPVTCGAPDDLGLRPRLVWCGPLALKRGRILVSREGERTREPNPPRHCEEDFAQGFMPWPKSTKQSSDAGRSGIEQGNSGGTSRVGRLLRRRDLLAMTGRKGWASKTGLARTCNPQILAKPLFSFPRRAWGENARKKIERTWNAAIPRLSRGEGQSAAPATPLQFKTSKFRNWLHPPAPFLFLSRSATITLRATTAALDWRRNWKGEMPCAP